MAHTLSLSDLIRNEPFGLCRGARQGCNSLAMARGLRTTHLAELRAASPHDVWVGSRRAKRATRRMPACCSNVRLDVMLRSAV